MVKREIQNITKACIKCNTEKGLNNFNWQSKPRGIKRALCQDCDRARANKDYKENREVRRASSDAYQKRIGYVSPGGYLHNPIAGCYMIVNHETGERYIGSSKNVYRRRSHWMVGNSHLDLNMNKSYWGVIEECDNYLEQEKYYISLYKPELNTRNVKIK